MAPALTGRCREVSWSSRAQPSRPTLGISVTSRIAPGWAQTPVARDPRARHRTRSLPRADPRQRVGLCLGLSTGGIGPCLLPLREMIWLCPRRMSTEEVALLGLVLGAWDTESGRLASCLARRHFRVLLSRLVKHVPLAAVCLGVTGVADAA